MGKIVEQTKHVKVERVAAYDEYRVAYKGLHKAREEAMAYYTDDREDAVGTMKTMERDSLAHVFNDDIKDRSKWSDQQGRP